MVAWSKESIIAALKDAATDGVVSYAAASKRHVSLPTVAKRRFGSFAEAAKEAGLKSASAVLSERPKREQCTAVGCHNPPRSPTHRFCEACFARYRRNGHTAYRQLPRVIEHSHGYNLLLAPDHDLTTEGQRARVYEHRAEFYRANGKGPFACHWCGSEVTWRNAYISRLEGDRKDNDPSNLIPCCPGCHVKRHSQRISRTLRDSLSEKITFRGETRPLPDWAEALGISRQSLRNRLASGWSLERALTERRGKAGPRSARISDDKRTGTESVSRS